MLCPGIDKRGSTLAAVLALAFLVTAVTTISLARIACSWSQISSRHRQAKALFLAEAGVERPGKFLDRKDLHRRDGHETPNRQLQCNSKARGTGIPGDIDRHRRLGNKAGPQTDRPGEDQARGRAIVSHRGLEGTPMNRRGFTFIEVITVLSIIAVLASILFPAFAQARESARKHTCQSNLQQIATALHLYAQDNSGRFPRRNNDFAPLLPYTKSRWVFSCPSDSLPYEYYYPQPTRPGEKPKPRSKDVESSYVYLGGLTDDDRKDTIIAGESMVFHGDGANVLCIGGRVKSVSADDYVPVLSPGPPAQRENTEQYGPAPPPVPPPGGPAPGGPRPGPPIPAGSGGPQPMPRATGP